MVWNCCSIGHLIRLRRRLQKETDEIFTRMLKRYDLHGITKISLRWLGVRKHLNCKFPRIFLQNMHKKQEGNSLVFNWPNFDDLAFFCALELAPQLWKHYQWTMVTVSFCNFFSAQRASSRRRIWSGSKMSFAGRSANQGKSDWPTSKRLSTRKTWGIIWPMPHWTSH